VIPEGLRIIPSFVTVAEEDALVQMIEPSSTIVESERRRERARVERYGPGVCASGYSTGVVVDELPLHLTWISSRLIEQGLIDKPSNAITVNEYLPGQGLGFHTDVEQAGEVISILGLAGSAELVFRALDIEVVVPFERRMLIQLTGTSRWMPWQHAIRLVDARRISIVFRYAE
jgi:alkylated DNA repair dioxygenase AlkB